MLFTRIRNLWKLSGVEVEAPKNKALHQRILEAVTGKKQATIIDLSDLPDMFPDHDHETIK